MNGLMNDAFAMNELVCSDMWSKTTLPHKIFCWNNIDYSFAYREEEMDSFLEVEDDDSFLPVSEVVKLQFRPDERNGSDGGYASTKPHTWSKAG